MHSYRRGAHLLWPEKPGTERSPRPARQAREKPVIQLRRAGPDYSFSLGAAMPRKTRTARFSRTRSSSARRPIRAPILHFGTVVILSTISRQTARSPFLSLGSTASRNKGASVGSVVKAHIVIDSVLSKRSSCRITTGRGFRRNPCRLQRSKSRRASLPAPSEIASIKSWSSFA